MKRKLCRCAIGILAALSLDAAIAVNASEIPENAAEPYSDSENSSDDGTVGWQEPGGEPYCASGWQEIGEEKYYFLPETGAMVVGWQLIDGEQFYFTLETGAMATGWQEIDGEKFYFTPETGAMATGWQEIDGERYYFSLETGSMLTGRHKIEKKAYFFDDSGILCTCGWCGTDSQTYYCGPQGVLVSGWKKIHGYKYYFLPRNNRMACGLHKINGSYYIFHDDGKLARSDGITIVTARGEIYCAGPDGKAAGGWQIKGNKLYYASKTGKVKRNTTYQGVTFTKTGAAKENTASRLKIKLIREVASITNRKMDRQTKLAACWSYLIGGTFRYACKYPDLNRSGWQRQTAYDMLTTQTGNCYSFACAFAALASEIGYEPYIVCGRVHGSRDRAADGYTRHAWVMIGGKHYDPEAHYAGWLRNVYARSSYPASNRIQEIVSYNE